MAKLARRLEKEYMWNEKFGEPYAVYKRRKLAAERDQRKRGKGRKNKLSSFMDNESIGSRRQTVDGKIFKYDVDADGNAFATTSTISQKRNSGCIDIDGDETKLQFATIAGKADKEKEREQ